MNLIEALKSGKRFSREVWPDWIEADQPHLFTKEDVMAQDWEIEEQKVKKKMFNAIYKSANVGFVLSGALYESEQDARETLRDQFIALGPAVEFEVSER